MRKQIGATAKQLSPAQPLDGVECASLALLARTSPAVAAALAAGNGKGAADPIEWLSRIDRLLRHRDEAGAIVAFSEAVCALQAGTDWDAFLRAVSLDATTASDVRRDQGRLRSLWGVTPIISLRYGVAAERSLGIEAESLVLTTYNVTQDFDLVLSPHVEAARAAGAKVEAAFYWLVFVWAVLSHDAFFFFYDRGILPPEESTGRFQMGILREELVLLRQSGKLIYTLPYGADYRTRLPTIAASRFNFCMDCPTIGRFCFCNSEAWPRVLYPIGAYATAILGCGLALAQIPGARRLEHVVTDPDAIQPHYPDPQPGRPLRIVHVPNHPHFKGTRYLETAVGRLSSDRSVEFILKKGISNAEVLELMRGADVVVDQLIGGNFGLTALEAMALGKPVVAYLADLSIVLAPDECPIINANPDTIQDVLRRVIEARHTLGEVGRRSRAYVERHYSVAALAARLKQLYIDTAEIDVASIARGTPARPARVAGSDW